MAAKIKVPLPTWAFNYSSPYSATYTDVPNVSVNYPSYTYMNMNSYINKQNTPAYVDHALMGVCGQGMSFYGTLNSYVVQGDPTQWKYTTHVWSMAIPDTFTVPVGLFTINAWAGCGYPPNYDTLGPSVNYNVALYIDTDHYLKVGSMYNGSSYPPMLINNTGVDMSPYLYHDPTDSSGAYIGHRYGVVYNENGRSYDLYIDNSDSRIAAVEINTIATGALLIMNNSQYWEWFATSGGFMNNYSDVGPGVYMYNYSSSYNIYNQGNIYMSDWYAWHNTLNRRELNAVLNWNFKILQPPKNASYYGALYCCNDLRSITIPGSVNEIPYNAIYGRNLEAVNLSEGITTVSQNGIMSNSNLTVNVAKSTVVISSRAVCAPVVNAPTISYNLYMRTNMFSNIATDYPFERYESFVGLSATNLSLKQPKPYRWYDGGLYQLPNSIKVYENLPTITTVDNMLHCDWHSLNVQLLFNETINKAVHTNAYGTHISKLNNAGYLLNIYSLEQPWTGTLQYCNFIYDEGFYYSMFIDTYGPAASIQDHVTELFTDVPDALDGTLIVREVDFSRPGMITPNVIEIHVPHKATEASNIPVPTLKIRNIPACVDHALVTDGHSVNVVCNDYPRADATIPCPNFLFININYLLIFNNYNSCNVSFELTNCFGVYGYAIPNCTPRIIADNYITVNGIYTGYDLSDKPLNFRYWRAHKYGITETNKCPIEDSFYADKILASDIISSAYLASAPSPSITDCFNYLITPFNQFDDTASMEVHNSALPSSIILSNWMHGPGSFINCSGASTVTIDGMAFGNQNGGHTSYAFVNHSGILNFDVNAIHIPYTTRARYNYGSNYAMQGYGWSGTITLCDLCTVGYININTPAFPTEGTNRYAAALDDGSIIVWANNSTISTIQLKTDLTSLRLVGCSVENISLLSNNICALYFDNTAIGHALQPLIDVSHSVTLNNVSMVDTAPIFNIRREGLGLRETNVSLSNVQASSSITINDAAGHLNAIQYANRLHTPHVAFKGLSTGGTNMFEYSSFTSAHLETMILSAGTLHNCINLTTVTGLENCLYIGDNAFFGCTNVTQLTVHPKCSIHPNAFMFWNDTSRRFENRIADVTITRATNTPVALNVDYNVMINGELVDSRTVDGPSDFGSIHNRIKVNAVYADNTEVPVDDYYIIPDFACSNNAPNTMHTVFAAGCIMHIDKPYKNTLNPHTKARRVDMSNSSAYGQTHEVYNGAYGGVVISGMTSTAGYAYKGRIEHLYSHCAMRAVVINNIYTAFWPILYNSSDFEYLISTNSTPNWRNSETSGSLSSSYRIREYFRDDGMNTDVGTSKYSYASNTAMLDFHSSHGYCAMNSNMIKNSGAYMVVLPPGGAIYPNAFNNCRNLFYVGFSSQTRSLAVYANAFVNCPSLQYLELPRSTTLVDSGALNRTGLKAVKIPSNCTVLTNAFPIDCTITYY